MNTTALIPPLVSLLFVGLLVGLVWGVLRLRRPDGGLLATEAPDSVLMGGLAFAAFALGVFLAYVLLHGLL